MIRRRLSPRAARLAHIAPLPPAAFAVHQLRYMLAFGAHSSAELARTGHSYLHSVVPWVVLCLALVAGGFLRSLGRTVAGQTSLPRYTASLAGMWAACAGALLAIFICQEALEGLFLTGHPAGLAGIFGYGGWWAIPVSLAIGLVLAAWFHGARWVLREVARRRAARLAYELGPTARPLARPATVWLPRTAPLLSGRSGRGPPCTVG